MGGVEWGGVGVGGGWRGGCLLYMLDTFYR